MRLSARRKVVFGRWHEIYAILVWLPSRLLVGVRLAHVDPLDTEFCRDFIGRLGDGGVSCNVMTEREVRRPLGAHSDKRRCLGKSSGAYSRSRGIPTNGSV